MSKQTLILPDFVIIGANKAGTTSLAKYLSSHPKVKVSDVKEPMFFNSTADMISASKQEANLKNPYIAMTINQYSKMFEKHDKSVELFAEASTAYLATPKISASLMKKIIPNTKIIAVLREPVSRAVSAYKMCVGNGIENRPFSEIVKNAKNEMKAYAAHSVKEYIRNGLYSQLLEPYYSYFEKENLLILNYDDFIQKPKEFLSRIFEFLNIEEVEIDFSKKYNTASEHVKKDELKIRESDLNTLKKLFKKELINLEKLTGIKFKG
jgi:hypothetical protein